MAAALRVVSDPKPTVIDFGVVESGIAEHGGETIGRSQAFTRLVLDTVFGVPLDEIDEHIVDGGADRGIDIVYIDHGKRRINIGSCKTVKSFRKSQNFFPAEEIDKLITFVDDVVFLRAETFSACNPKLRNKLDEIWEILGSEKYEVAVHLFSNQAPLNKDARERLAETLSRNRIPLFEYGLFHLSHGLVKSTKPKFKKKLVPTGGSALKSDGNNKRAIVTRVGLEEVAKFLDRDGQFDERLVWQNVRYFLGVENEVNREIRRSLTSDLVEDFYYLNSGLVIVCDQVASLDNGYHPLTLVNPQIVNGCQTAAVIHSVAMDTLEGVSGGSVQVRIIETEDRELIEKIALASNTQSRILGRDLRANDPLQLQIARCLKELGVHYRRKRGESTPAGLSLTLDAARAGQLMLAYLVGEPAKSKTDSNEIFGELYAEAFNPHAVTPDVLMAALKCHLLIDERRRKALAWQSSISGQSYDETWLIEGHFHALFVVGELMKRRGLELGNAAEAVSLVDEALAVVQSFVIRQPKVSFYRMFRLAQSKDQLLKILQESKSESPSYSVQLKLFPESGA
ncbi:MAG: AIPR family protein [Devosia marina]|uniref:AIPR family protein n=1 Tax=Devosia marina TaxID=2683198 RepID=UPI0032EBAC85